MELPTADLWAFSDGSGYTDGFGGWAAIGCLPEGNNPEMRLGGASGTTVDRMEITAMLEALQIVWEIANRRWSLESVKPRVVLFSDRESIVLTIRAIYGINSAHDLWQRYFWYAQRLDVYAFHLDEKHQTGLFEEVDLHASSMRQVIKAYVDAFK